MTTSPSEEMEKTFANFKVADISNYSIEVLGEADNLDEAKQIEAESKAERGDGACVLIFRYDADKCRYIELKGE